MQALDDTIAAIATATGAAGLAVVRVSGRDALAVGGSVFHGGRPLTEVASHTLHHGWAMWPERPGDGHSAAAPKREQRALVDEVVAAVFRAPRSYTREDVVEFSCHGGRLSAQRLLAALLAAGARLARPGEFTLRAFLGGRLDLAQAEAVADLIHAETESARELALSQLAGGLSRTLDELSECITECLSEVEARVDFAEDVGGIEVPDSVIETIASADAALVSMLEGAAYARAVREGVRLPIVGRPNVGKSSLFNALLGEERAIVTPAPGTTRDRVTEAIEVAGVRVTLSDTAGMRAAPEPIEAIGIRQTEAALSESRFVLWAVDGSAALADEDRAIGSRLAGKCVLVALNKRDLGAAVDEREIAGMLNGATLWRAVPVSAARGQGMDAIRSALEQLLGAGRDGDGLGGAVGNARHAEALTRARAALARAAAAGRDGAPGEIVALELRESLAAIGEVTGKSIGDDLLDRIFQRFCIGK
jgi:tRNA modification GTPase